MTKPKDITPEDSVVPVFLDATPEKPVDGPFGTVKQDERAAALSSGLEKLMASADLTEDEARAIAGL